MDYKSFFKNIKAGTMSGAYLLYGEEEYIKDMAVESIINTYVNQGLEGMNVVKLNGSECDYAKIENACMTLPFMAQRRIVIVGDYDLFKSSAMQLKQASVVEKIEKHKNILKQCPKETILLLMQRGAVNDTIVKLFDKTQKADFKHPTAGDKEKALTNMAKKANLNISNSNIRTLIEFTSMDLLAINQEVMKLKSYVCDNEVTEDDIFAICTAGTEYSIFTMLNCITNKNGAKAISIYRQLIMEGQSPQSIISMIERQYRALFYMRDIRNTQKDYQDVADKLRTKKFIIDKMERLTSKVSRDDVKKIATWCADADYLIKRGKISVESSAEMLIMRLINL